MNDVWREWFTIAYGHMKLRPHEFWAMTLADWFALQEAVIAAAPGSGTLPMTRQEFEDMAEQYR